MAENLRTTKYNDSSAIPQVKESSTWSTLTTGAYCNYNNTANVNIIATYGRLYNWYAIGTGKLAPKGYHVPTKDEWTTLANYLGGENVAGGKLKEAGTNHWNTPNTQATNETGFIAMPGGIRSVTGEFYGMGDDGFWYSDSDISYIFDRSWFWVMPSLYGYLTSYDTGKLEGFSVRCIKD